jgi:hypothetical protein
MVHTLLLLQLTLMAFDVAPSPKLNVNFVAPGPVLKFPPTTVTDVPPVPGPLLVCSAP